MSETPVLLSREALLKKTINRRYQTIDLPTGGSVRIRSITEKERSEYEVAMLKFGGKRKNEQGKMDINQKALQTARLRLIVLCLVDDKDNRMFNDDEISLLQSMDSADAKVIGDACDAMLNANSEYFEELMGNSDLINVVSSPSA